MGCYSPWYLGGKTEAREHWFFVCTPNIFPRMIHTCVAQRELIAMHTMVANNEDNQRVFSLLAVLIALVSLKHSHHLRPTINWYTAHKIHIIAITKMCYQSQTKIAALITSVTALSSPAQHEAGWGWQWRLKVWNNNRVSYLKGKLKPHDIVPQYKAP